MHIISEQNPYSLMSQSNSMNAGNNLTRRPSGISEEHLREQITIKPEATPSPSSETGEVVATVETSSASRQTTPKGMFYRKEQFSGRFASRIASPPSGERIDLNSQIRNIRAASSEFPSAANETVTDAQMDAFLRKAFRLFDIPQ